MDAGVVPVVADAADAADADTGGGIPSGVASRPKLPKEGDVIMAKGERWTVKTVATPVDLHCFELCSEASGRVQRQSLKARKADGKPNTSGGAWEWAWASLGDDTSDDAAASPASQGGRAMGAKGGGRSINRDNPRRGRSSAQPPPAQQPAVQLAVQRPAVQAPPNALPNPAPLPLNLKHTSLTSIKKELKDTIAACAAPTVQSTTWDDVVGIEHARKIIDEEVIGPIKNPALYSDVPGGRSKGMLLFGPAGTGKTMTAKAVALRLGFHFFEVKGSLVSKWKGESEKYVDALFAVARVAEPGAILFIDECDSLLCRGTGEDSADHNKLVNSFKAAWDGVSSGAGHVFVICATNYPWAIEPALLREGRMDFKLLVTYPSRDARLKLLHRQLSTFKIDNTDETLQWLADHTNGYSGAGLVSGIMREATMGSIRDAEAHGITDPKMRRPIRRDDFERALCSVKRPDGSELERHEQWNREHGTQVST